MEAAAAAGGGAELGSRGGACAACGDSMGGGSRASHRAQEGAGDEGARHGASSGHAAAASAAGRGAKPPRAAAGAAGVAGDNPLAALVELGLSARSAGLEKGTLDELPDAAIAHVEMLQQQVERSHEMIGLLVRRCLEEKAAKDTALSAVHEALEAAVAEPAADGSAADGSAAQVVGRLPPSLPPPTQLRLQSLLQQNAALRQEAKQLREMAGDGVFV